MTAMLRILHLLSLSILSLAFIPPRLPTGLPSGLGFGGGDDFFPPPLDGFQDDSSTIIPPPPTACCLNQTESAPGTDHRPDTTEAPTTIRGGGARESPGLIGAAAGYWKKTLGSIASAITTPFRGVSRAISGRFKSTETKEEEELLHKLRTTPVRTVTVPGSDVLPVDVVQIAAKRAGILGKPLQSESVQELAKNIKQWYMHKGYLLHSVTGATLKPESGVAEINVQEPVLSRAPVGISVLKEMVVDEVTGETISLRQYKDRYAQRKGWRQEEIKREDLNVTYVPAAGKVKPHRIAEALGMRPGRPFQWDEAQWLKVRDSGLFSNIFQAVPQPMADGSVQLQIVATEAPTRQLEYGVGKSLYTGGWEGEVDFEHSNLLGGAETLGLNVRRGASDSQVSARVKFTNGRLAPVGGYDVEAFTEYLGKEGAASPQDNRKFSFIRRGATFRVRNPIDSSTIRHSVASASLERTSSYKGDPEVVASTTMDVGPFFRELPLGARSNLDVSATVGTRFPEEAWASKSQADSSSGGPSILPYGSITATTRQLFPIFGPGTRTRRPILLALRHSCTSSTDSIPVYVSRAIGTSTKIRGSPPNGLISSAIRGTTEIRVPIKLPGRMKTAQDASVVVFGDWLLASTEKLGSFTRKSSIGLGLRKSLQGIPLQYDITYSPEGKIRTTLGFGSDFVF